MSGRSGRGGVSVDLLDALVSSSAADEMSSAEVWKSPLTSSIALASISAEFRLDSVAAWRSWITFSIDSGIESSVCWAWQIMCLGREVGAGAWWKLPERENASRIRATARMTSAPGTVRLEIERSR